LRFEKPPEGVESTTEEQRLLKEKELLGFFLTGHPLDLYKEKLKSIESTPFSKVTDMAPGAFCSACIIEKVTVKLLQRNQSKFAIVTFSQKGDFLEVPVWPGTYEEFQELLVEGRLVYGVFRVDGAGDKQKLACRWLCDLNMLSDEAQEEAKEIKKQTAKEQKRMQKKSKEVEKPEEPKEQLELKVDLTKIRASRVLQLKKLLRSFPGPNPVCIEFQRGGQRVSLLKISAPWGVEISSFLTQSLEKVDGVQSVNTLNIS
jgi:DNA polymerase III subunit alpha